MRRMILLLAGLFLAGVGALGAAEYYLDSANGSDAVDGLSPQTAWQTIAQTKKAGIQPGDRVLFKRGEIWRENLTAADGEEGNPVYYGAYGEGRKPILLGSIDLTNPDIWLSPEEGSKIWKTRPDRIETAQELDWFNSPFHIYVEKPADAAMAQKDFDGQTGYSVTAEKNGDVPSRIQVILPSVSIHKEEIVRLKFRVRSSIPFALNSIAILKTGKPWTNYAKSCPTQIDVKNDWTEAELLFCPNETDENSRLTIFLGKTIPDGAVFDFVPLAADLVTINSAGLTVSSGAQISDVGNIILTPKGKLPADEMLRYEDDTNRFAAFKRWKPEDLTVQNDFWYDKVHRSIWFYSEENPALMFDEMEAACRGHLCRVSKYATLENLAIGFTSAHGVAGLDNSNGCVIRNCDIFWIGGGEIGGYANPTRFGNGIEFWATGKNHLVENCRFWEVYDVALSIQGPVDTVYENITWRNNLIWNCEQSFEIWLRHPNSEVRNVVFEKNRCYDAGYGWAHVQRPNKNGTHLLSYNLDSKKIDFKIQDNIFSRAKSGLTMFWNDRIGEFDINRNTWWQPEEEGTAGMDQPIFQWGLAGPKYAVPFEEYREKTGNDADSVFAEPEVNLEKACAEFLSR